MIKAGILGGGQLGRMLLQAAANYPVTTYVLENDSDCPAAHLCHHFVKGNITNYDDVYQFGKNLHVLTIEIENVNVDALEKLEEEGVRIYPKPATLRMLKNKILQKQFYHDHQIPTAPFVVTQNRSEAEQQHHLLPAVHKLGEGGYDGRGVQVIRTVENIALAFDAPAVLEKMVNIQHELAVMVAVSDSGAVAVYPAVDMIFDPELNLLNYQCSPPNLPTNTIKRAEEIALHLVQKFGSAGLFAVELFVDDQNKIWVNETAPRVHNSGHHTIEANYCSQFDMMWRILLQYPLGNTASMMPSALINLVGEEGYSGEPMYDGIVRILEMDQVFIHIYGKRQTRGGRKMGHITVLNNDINQLLSDVEKVKSTIRVIA